MAALGHEQNDVDLLLLVMLLWLESVMANCHRNDLGVYVLTVGNMDKL